MRALPRKLWRDAWHYRGQLTAIAAVVLSGMALFVSLRSMHGHLRGSRDAYYRTARFGDLFAQVRRAPLRVADEVGRLPGVRGVEARVVTDVVLDVRGLDEPAAGRLVSIPVPRAAMLNALTVTRGRWPDAAHPDEALASQAFARANGLVPGDSVGAVVNGAWRWLHLTGTAISPEYVYEIGGASIFPDNRRFGVLWMGREALGGAFDLQGAFNDLVVTLAPGADTATALAAIDDLLSPFGGRGAFARTEQVSDQFLTGEIEETQVTSVLLPGVFLAVTAFLLHLVLSRLVGTQREQVATLKAFGYERGAISLHYVGLALVPIVAGGVAGGAFGTWLAVQLAGVYARFFQFPPTPFVPDPRILAQGFVVAGLAGVIGALGAAWRSAALPPAEAMRPETPARYRPGILGALHLHPSPQVSVIVRSLERRPWKSMASVTGLALAGGLVITSLGLFDTIDFMKVLQFHVVDRSDATVALAEASPPDAVTALRRVNGVLDAEGFRVLPVRLVSARGTYRTTLVALDTRAELRRVVDLREVTHRMPPVGLLLAEPLADTLRVRPGDTVHVEVLEGERRHATTVVAATVADMMGMTGYLDLGGAARITGGDVVVSGAYLRVDPRRAREAFASFKRLPRAAGVGSHEAALRGFEATIAESFSISLVTTLAFACVIAFGIVYNSGRITLSERGRELASLRILGFTHREVGTMLVGEQAVLTLASVPLAIAVAWGLSWLISVRFESTLFRLPVVISLRSHVVGLGVVWAAAAASAVLILRRLRRFDLVEVLKTRE